MTCVSAHQCCKHRLNDNGHECCVLTKPEGLRVPLGQLRHLTAFPVAKPYNQHWCKRHSKLKIKLTDHFERESSVSGFYLDLFYPLGKAGLLGQNRFWRVSSCKEKSLKLKTCFVQQEEDTHTHKPLKTRVYFKMSLDYIPNKVFPLCTKLTKTC